MGERGMGGRVILRVTIYIYIYAIAERIYNDIMRQE
jgi:hypothetical protein